MAVCSAEVVGAAVVVERELELLLLVGDTVEVVRRLELAVADDLHLAPELEPERLVERAAATGIGDAVHRVQVPGHAAILRMRRGPRPLCEGVGDVPLPQ